MSCISVHGQASSPHDKDKNSKTPDIDSSGELRLPFSIQGSIRNLRGDHSVKPGFWALEDWVNITAHDPGIVKVGKSKVLPAKRSQLNHHTFNIQSRVNDVFLVDHLKCLEDLEGAL